MRRPDREVRNQRAVDFEVALSSGAIVAVEVTSAAIYIADFLAAGEFESEAEARLAPVVEAGELGTVALRVHYAERPRKRDIHSLVASVVHKVSTALTVPDAPAISIDAPHPIESLEVIRLGRERNVIGWVSSPVPAWFVESQADEFITELVASKATQAEGYEEAWIVIFERTPIMTAETLISAFAQRRSDLPANWRRIYYVQQDAVCEVHPAWTEAE